MEKRGAFQLNQPALVEYDQLVDGQRIIADTLNDRKLDVVVDDGLHSVDAIVTTWRSVSPHLARPFVYFIEDFDGLLDACGDEFGGFERHSFGEITVISSSNA